MPMQSTGGEKFTVYVYYKTQKVDKNYVSSSEEDSDEELESNEKSNEKSEKDRKLNDKKDIPTKESK
jgi:hypothetical protein